MPANTAAIASARSFSHYLDRQLTARPEEADRLAARLDQPFDADEMAAFADWGGIDNIDTLSPALRKLRIAVMARLITRDHAGLADLHEVVTTISLLADFAVQTTLPVARRALANLGDPIGEESGTVQELIVIGMGKLGGYELNVSSDIDLIFIYPEDGDTNGARRLSNHEYFTRLGKLLINAINDLTYDGQVFRVDMRLRPYGDSGPLVMSLAALENYLLTQGREWERYAWIKARVMSGDASQLEPLVRPFVYRKYLDYGAYGAMRELHAQIRREVARRDMADNIKLGPGGIREVEFIAQVFQLIRGGRERRLQLKSTRDTYTVLADLRLLEPDTVSELLGAYTFLRNLEHRLQYLDDQQTQSLPASEESRQRIATSMGFADWQAFLDELNRHRRRVTRHFEQVFFLPTEGAAAHPLENDWRDIANVDIAPRLASLGYHHPDDMQRQLRNLACGQRYLQMPDASRKKLDALMGPLMEVAASFDNPDTTLQRILQLIDAISRRASYLSLLLEYPQTLQRLASLYSSSAWVSDYLSRHPILLDELLDARVLYATPDWPQLAAQLEQQLQDCHGDVEAQMDALRHFQHAQTFRLVAQDLAGMWTLEALSDELSRLADLVLDVTVRHAWLDIPKRHRDVPLFSVVGYGKLGGKELGYASDLDVIFLYEDDHPDAADLYSRLARKIISWLTSTTSAGVLYDVDIRLRPDGASGLLVSTTDAFQHYQHHKAWLWEHQALTRARFVCGDTRIGARFEAIRQQVLALPRDPATLGCEVVAMRNKMLESHAANPDDVKHARGGIIDVEFIVQFLILAHAGQHPALLANSGNIALLAAAADAGLIETTLAESARQAYRHYRRLQHASRLDGSSRIAQPPLDDYARVQALWHAVLGPYAALPEKPVHFQ